MEAWIVGGVLMYLAIGLWYFAPPRSERFTKTPLSAIQEILIGPIAIVAGIGVICYFAICTVFGRQEQ